jgi:hypothetical protein
VAVGVVRPQEPVAAAVGVLGGSCSTHTQVRVKWADQARVQASTIYWSARSLSHEPTAMNSIQILKLLTEEQKTMPVSLGSNSWMKLVFVPIGEGNVLISLINSSHLTMHS